MIKGGRTEKNNTWAVTDNLQVSVALNQEDLDEGLVDISRDDLLEMLKAIEEKEQGGVL